jgi:hypothetical protein
MIDKKTEESKTSQKKVKIMYKQASEDNGISFKVGDVHEIDSIAAKFLIEVGAAEITKE